MHKGILHFNQAWQPGLIPGSVDTIAAGIALGSNAVVYADGVPVIVMSETSPLHSVSPDFCVTPGARSRQLQLAEELEEAQILRETTWLRKAGSKRKHGSSGSS